MNSSRHPRALLLESYFTHSPPARSGGPIAPERPERDRCDELMADEIRAFSEAVNEGASVVESLAGIVYVAYETSLVWGIRSFAGFPFEPAGISTTNTMTVAAFARAMGQHRVGSAHRDPNRVGQALNDLVSEAYSAAVRQQIDLTKAVDDLHESKMSTSPL